MNTQEGRKVNEFIHTFDKFDIIWTCPGVDEVCIEINEVNEIELLLIDQKRIISDKIVNNRREVTIKLVNEEV